jgi:hypothetical protein
MVLQEFLWGSESILWPRDGGQVSWSLNMGQLQLRHMAILPWFILKGLFDSLVQVHRNRSARRAGVFGSCKHGTIHTCSFSEHERSITGLVRTVQFDI